MLGIFKDMHGSNIVTKDFVPNIVYFNLGKKRKNKEEIEMKHGK